MATANEVLAKAAGEIGYSRWTDPEHGTKYGRWYAEQVGSSYFGESGVPYCAMFVSWVLGQVGYTPKFLYAYCPYIDRDFNSRKVAKAQAQPGDIVLFDWGGDGVADHVGFVELNKGSYLQTIEGNTSNGQVKRCTRNFGTVKSVIRPEYGVVPVPSGGLTVDGYWGTATTAAAQKIAGTTVDGEISSQPTYMKSKLKGCTGGWQFSNNAVGSKFIIALQKVLGVTPDGFFGVNSVNAFIKRYGNGIQDGKLDYPSEAIKGFQKSLNEGKL